MKPRLFTVVVLGLIAACTPTSADSTTTTTTSPPATTAPPATTTPTLARCSEEFEFAEGSGIADLDHADSDSRTLAAISWDDAEGCETFVFGFETAEGAPATTPPSVQVGHLDYFQIMRIRLFGVEETVIADQLIETGLVERAFVVRSLDGGMFVDLHLANPAQARLEASGSPAELILTVKPGLVPFSGQAAVGDRVVVSSPPGGASVGQFFNLEGYARTREAAVLIVGRAGDEVVAERDTIAADWQRTWGEFRATVDLPPGAVSLFVGEANALDGSLEGVTIRVRVR